MATVLVEDDTFIGAALTRSFTDAGHVVSVLRWKRCARSP